MSECRQAIRPTSSQKLRGHVSDSAIGASIHRLRAQSSTQAKVCHLGCEAALIGIAVGQQDIAASQVPMQQVLTVQV